MTVKNNLISRFVKSTKLNVTAARLCLIACMIRIIPVGAAVHNTLLGRENLTVAHFSPNQAEQRVNN